MSAGTVLAVAVTLAAGSAWADEKVERSSEVSRESAGERVEPSTEVSRESTWEKAEPSIKVSSEESYSYASASADEKVQPSTKVSGGGSHSSASSSSRSSSRSEKVPQTDAQRRHPRPGTGTGRFDNDGRRGYDYRYTWGSPYYGGRYGRFGYYYNPYDYWYSPYYYSGYYGYSPSYYRRGRGYGYYRDNGSLRIIVDPEKTRVYVDGYYAGIADDFDGIFQRLNVPPGRHDITLKLEGYRTQHFKVYVPVDDTIKIHYDMVRGAGEATSDQFAGVPADYARVEDLDDEAGRRGDDDGRYDRRDDSRDQGDTGSVRLQVSPRDASVYIDGEFRGSGRQSANLRLRPGRHRIEVVRPGYRTVEREIEVEAGRSTELEFDLEKL